MTEGESVKKKVAVRGEAGKAPSLVARAAASAATLFAYAARLGGHGEFASTSAPEIVRRVLEVERVLAAKPDLAERDERLVAILDFVANAVAYYTVVRDMRMGLCDAGISSGTRERLEALVNTHEQLARALFLAACEKSGIRVRDPLGADAALHDVLTARAGRPKGGRRASYSSAGWVASFRELWLAIEGKRLIATDEALRGREAKRRKTLG